jgi:hypothetical protein
MGMSVNRRIEGGAKLHARAFGLRSTTKALSAATCTALGMLFAAGSSLAGTFIPGDLVISEVGRVAPGDTTTYSLDQATSILLQQLHVTGTTGPATASGSVLLPQSANGNNAPISGEFGSASEGMLQRSGNGQFLTIMGYGINAATFNSNPGAYTGSPAITALGQSQSSQVARVVGLIGANGSVDTTTALTNVYNTQNPRSAYTVGGTSFYVSGQGATKTDPTQGVFYATLGATTATVIDNSTDTRDVQIVDGKLYVSRDYNPPGSGAQQSNVGTLTNGTANPPTTAAGVVKTAIIPTGNNGNHPADPPNNTTTFPAIYLNPTDSNGNNVNGPRKNNFVYASPEQFFFASPSVLYVADSGSPKNGNVEKAALGDGGLQKWINSSLDGSGTWSLAYTLYSGLNGGPLTGVVNNDPAVTTGGASNGYGGFDHDVTGLFGLTGQVLGDGTVELYATSYTKNELDTSYLFGITDLLSATILPTSETFSTLLTSAPDVSIRGVSFAPVAETPLPAALPLLATGLGVMGFFARRRRCGPRMRSSD